jgi:KH/beta-lactamase-domain protein
LVQTSLNDNQAKIREAVFKYIPKEAEVSRIEYEGPRIAIYSKRPGILLEHSSIIGSVVSAIRKRIVIRSDPTVRLSEPETEKIIHSLIVKEAEITNITFDPSLGEVSIEAKKPGLVIGKNGSSLQEITVSTNWRPIVLRSPPIPSKIIAHVRHFLHSESKDRERILRNVGERIFRPKIFETDYIRMTSLGGFKEVGRSSILIETKESRVLLDCGINPGSKNPVKAYPGLSVNTFDLDRLDAVIISHAHLDHCGFLPFLYKYGYDGPVYCSAPTASLMTLLQLDYLDVSNNEGSVPPYDQKDVREKVLHTIPLNNGIVTDLSPDIRLTLHNAGHILGSSIIHLHIGEGLHNVVYTGDFKYGQTMLLEPAPTRFPRVETLIIESTYGAPEDIMPTRKETEERLVSIINKTIVNGGKTLIPVPAVGRAQEIMMVLDGYMRQGLLTETPIFIEGMINEATAVHTTYPEYLHRKLRERVFQAGENPFQSDYFVNVKDPNVRDDIVYGEPCIILATSGMLEGGPSVDYFKRLCSDVRNSLIFVSYQIVGTLGRRVFSGLREVPLINSDGRVRIFKVDLNVNKVDGFSGHSDRRQLISYVRRISPKPERIIVNHGEKAKCQGIATSYNRICRIKSTALDNLETIRLK